jgi:quercetin dioxygenase-like cupin family protein
MMSDSLPFVISSAEGAEFRAGPFLITARALGAQTKNAFELYELTLKRAGTIDYHVHRAMEETSCVIEGEVEFTVAAKRSNAPAGSVAYIPRGVHYGFTNPGPDQARVLILFTPASNQHEYFRELVKIFASSVVDSEALKSLQERYHQELVSLDG